MENHSKSHIGSYEIINFKALSHYNKPKNVSTRMKLTPKMDHFTVFKCLTVFLALIAAKFPPENLKVQKLRRALLVLDG